MENNQYAGTLKIGLFYFITAGVCHSIQAQSELRFRLVHNTLVRNVGLIKAVG